MFLEKGSKKAKRKAAIRVISGRSPRQIIFQVIGLSRGGAPTVAKAGGHHPGSQSTRTPPMYLYSLSAPNATRRRTMALARLAASRRLVNRDCCLRSEFSCGQRQFRLEFNLC
jgi:hypothetical protein